MWILLVILKILLKIILDLLLIILGLALILLIVPFNYKGQVLLNDGFRMQFALGWAWKLFGITAEIESGATDITFCISDKKVYRFKRKKVLEEAEETKEEPEKKEKDKKDKKGGKGPGLKELIDRTFLNEIFEYLKRLLDIAKPEYLHLYGIYGFDDPSITGIVCGVTGIIKSIVPHARLNLTPDFTEEVLNLDLCAEGSVAVGSIVYQTAKTALKRPVRKILFRKKKS